MSFADTSSMGSLKYTEIRVDVLLAAPLLMKGDKA